MKTWFKLRYHLSNGAPGITNIFIDVASIGDDLEDAIISAKPALVALLNIPAGRENVLKLVGIQQ
jgi:hypothetical protein